MQSVSTLLIIAFAFTGLGLASPANKPAKPTKPEVAKPVMVRPSPPDINNTQQVQCGSGMSAYCCNADQSTGDNKNGAGGKNKETYTCSNSVNNCGGSIVCCNNAALGSGNADQSCSSGIKVTQETNDIDFKQLTFPGFFF